MNVLRKSKAAEPGEDHAFCSDGFTESPISLVVLSMPLARYSLSMPVDCVTSMIPRFEVTAQIFERSPVELSVDHPVLRRG